MHSILWRISSGAGFLLEDDGCTRGCVKTWSDWGAPVICRMVGWNDIHACPHQVLDHPQKPAAAASAIRKAIVRHMICIA
jgi:hypothetical protein